MTQIIIIGKDLPPGREGIIHAVAVTAVVVDLPITISDHHREVEVVEVEVVKGHHQEEVDLPLRIH